MIIKYEYVILFFMACVVIGAVIVAGIAYLPVDKNAVCGPLIEAAVKGCICPAK